ncbi:aminotransferase class V-fold PLP-dependent enzyme, partial [Patescibacteria group bacterium]|nr:aminotransferase class V-fold PLP-dependent enzyme [Patescibacteria group bacterium]
LNLVVRYAKMTDGGEIDLENFRSLLSPATKIVSLSHCSNVFGRFIALSEIKKIMDEQGSAACLIADAAQSLPHLFPSVRDLGADFLVFSGHKVYGPSGIGVLWGREERLQTLPPYQTGGDMIRTVTLTGASWNALPWKFEAGTPNMEGAIGLAAALDYLVDQGTAAITDYTSHLSQTVRHSLEQIPSVRILGDPHPHSGIISFTVDGVHPHDLADLLGQKEICIRAGHHCAAPLHQQLGIPASNRISLGMYNTEADIDRFIAVLKSIITDFSHV